jgi:hypothetical protein
MLGVKSPLSAILLSGVCALAFSATAVHAASECKGLAQAECDAKGDCKWVEGYTRKDGKEVSGYCRSVAKKPEEGSAPKPAQ